MELDERTKNYDSDEVDGYEIHSDEEELPFKCFICR